VKDAKLYELREEYLPTMFMAVSQKQHPEQDETILIRSQVSLFSLISALKRTVQQINRGIDMDFTPIDRLVEVSLPARPLDGAPFRILRCARGASGHRGFGTG